MKKKKWPVVLIVILVLIAALALGGFIFVKSYLSKISRTGEQNVQATIAPKDEFFETDEEPADSEVSEGESTGEDTSTELEKPGSSESEEDAVESTTDPADVDWGDYIEQIEDDHLINILLVGQDRREYQVRQRSDCMILCSINPETGKVSLISFLRDLYVQIPGGYSDNRLNATYTFGGFDLLDATLTENFGVSIDGNLEVDFSGFETVIDTLGGVDIELTSSEAAYLGKAAGLNHLNGHDALAYSRIRSIDNDFARTGRQRKVLLNIYEKTKDLSINEILNLIDAVLPYVTTDMTDSEIISIAYRMLPILKSLSISTYTVPANDCYYGTRIQGMSVLVPDTQLIRQYLEEEYLPLE